MLLACLSTSCMHHEPKQPEVSHTQSQTLEEFFYPAPAGAEYHPRWNQPPPFWPPHEHIVLPTEPPPWLLQVQTRVKHNTN